MRGLGRPGLRRDESGISLIELLVAMVLTTIVMLIAVGLFSQIMNVSQSAGSLNTNTRQAANGMNEMARIIRAGTNNPVKNQLTPSPAFVAASAESLTIYTYVNQSSSDQTPKMVRFRVVRSGTGSAATATLVEDTWAATATTDKYWTFPAASTTPASSRTLASTVAAASTSTPLFTYLDGDGNPIAVPGTGFTAAQLGTIASVKVVLTIQKSVANATSQVTLQNTVGIPNLTLARRSS